jgi:hypothetical protein
MLGITPFSSPRLLSANNSGSGNDVATIDPPMVDADAGCCG